MLVLDYALEAVPEEMKEYSRYRAFCMHGEGTITMLKEIMKLDDVRLAANSIATLAGTKAICLYMTLLQL